MPMRFQITNNMSERLVRLPQQEEGHDLTPHSYENIRFPDELF